jgi:hypothetical protein
MGAFFAALPQKTGLSASILYAAPAAHKYFRFNPLRVRNPALFFAQSTNPAASSGVWLFS